MSNDTTKKNSALDRARTLWGVGEVDDGGRAGQKEGVAWIPTSVPGGVETSRQAPIPLTDIELAVQLAVRDKSLRGLVEFLRSKVDVDPKPPTRKI